MKACYLKPRTRLDRDISSALSGLEEMGYKIYEIEKLEFCEVPCLENIYVGCVGSTKFLFKKFEIPYPDVSDYPIELNGWFGRKIEADTWEGLNHRKKCRKFVKPQIKGIFTPFVGDFPNYEIDYLHISENTKIFVSDPIDIKAEYRAFIKNGRALDIRRYAGWYGYDCTLYVPEMLVSYKNEGKPFVLDIGIVNTGEGGLEQVVIECNPGICFGGYGLDPLLHAEMYVETYKHL